MATVHHHARRAILVTTSSFTTAATKLAGEHGVWLIDGDALVNLAVGASQRRPAPGPDHLLPQGAHLASGAAGVGTPHDRVPVRKLSRAAIRQTGNRSMTPWYSFWASARARRE
jgi:hypothetical protein